MQASHDRNQFFHRVFLHAGSGLALLSPDWHWLELNHRASELLGHDGASLAGRSLHDITHPDDIALDRADVHQLLAGAIDAYCVHKRCLRSDGVYITVEMNVTVGRGDAGAPDFFMLRIDDATRAADARAARTHDEKFRLLVENVSDAFIGMDQDGFITDWNRRAEALLQWRADEVIGRPMTNVLVPARFRERHNAGLRRFMQTGVPSIINKPVEVPLLRRDGVEVQSEMTVGAIRHQDRYYFASFVRDISQRKEMEQQLHHQATHDSLTGLPNRSEFMSRLERTLQARERGVGGGGLALLFIDLDGFKRVNDTHGHGAGDQLLTAFAARLRGCVRRTDSVARLSGDEFVVLLERVGNTRTDVLIIVEKLMQAARAASHLETPVTASIGIALYDGLASAQAFMQQSDAAMYAAKHAGKNRYVFHCDLVEATPLPQAAGGLADHAADHAAESARLSALYATRLLDTPPELMFDRMTALAARVLRMPMAFISLVDQDRQWFKSRCGVALQETPRAVSLCAHAITRDAPMIVNDARKDPRFAANPLVTGEPYLRFYAGIPLHGPNNKLIGTLCVADNAPRQLTDDDVEFLKGLANTIDELIGLRHSALASNALLSNQHDANGQAQAPSSELPDELRNMLMRDPLTGLANRVHIEEEIDRNADRWARTGLSPVAALVDIDNFNGINENYSYQRGDQVILELVQRIEAGLRPQDRIARVSGDLLLVLLCQEQPGDDLSQVLHRVHQASQFFANLPDKRVSVSSCVGYSSFGADGGNAHALINCAHAALRQAKTERRGKLQAYCDGPWQPDAQVAIEQDLSAAIERGELRLYYQPKVDLASGLAHGVEALVRWQHPVRGMVSPADFIPLAEDTGLIGPITEWVIATACAQIAAWARAGHRISVAVNLSTRLLGNDSMVRYIERMLAVHGVEGALLDVEVTETGSMSDPLKSSRLMHRIKALGASLSIDDFGTGYSSLSYLKDFPIDTIKIDRSFISEMEGHDEAMTVLQGMIATARRLNLKVVAEGVETLAQAAILKQESCDEIQGFLVSRPVPAEECERFFGRPLLAFDAAGSQLALVLEA
ncbi:MAG: EAL domain-containing protein [Gammaproteobacteria bacterium]